MEVTEIREGHDVGELCKCVANHNPNPTHIERHHIVPLYADGPNTEDNLIWVCPTTHENVHVLLRAWERAGGEPDWEIRKHYSVFARELARQGYENR